MKVTRKGEIFLISLATFWSFIEVAPRTEAAIDCHGPRPNFGVIFLFYFVSVSVIFFFYAVKGSSRMLQDAKAKCEYFPTSVY